MRGWIYGYARRRGRLIPSLPETPAPSLRFKKLAGYDQVWSVRINEQYRAVGEREGDSVVWVWIGSHNDFESLFG